MLARSSNRAAVVSLAALMLLMSSACADPGWRPATVASTWATTGSLYRGKHLHVGVRPNYEPGGGAVTVQITTDVIP
jgi:hypothetical protein